MIDFNKIIYIDVDDTIEDLLFAWCTYLNTKYDLYIDPNDAKEWDVTKLFTTLTHKQIYGALYDDELWKSVKPIAGAPKYIKKLMDDGFDVYLATATHAAQFKIKLDEVIFKYFPFIHEDHIITIHNKQLLRGLVLVDDYVENLKNSDYYGILFESYYNKSTDLSNLENVYMVSSWKDCYKKIHEIYDKVTK